jgi:hypothetical protein
MNLNYLKILPVLATLVLVATGCTTVAVLHEQEPSGPSVALRVCVLKDSDISCEQAGRIIADLTREMARSGIVLSVPWVSEWQRPGFFEKDIVYDVAAKSLEAPCDRILALVGRTAQDFAWGLLLPEVIGSVETVTRTKGFVVAEFGSFNQLLSFKSPSDAAAHELYHMLGCDHDDPAAVCAAKIGAIKQSARTNRANGIDFFPGIGSGGEPLLTRAAVRERFAFLGLSQPAIGLAALPLELPTCAVRAN